MYNNIDDEIANITSTMSEEIDFMSPSDLATSLRDIINTDNNPLGLPNYSPSTDMDQSKSPDELLSNTIKVYNEKYGLNLSVDTLTENLKVASFLSKNDKSVSELVKQGILSNAADYLYFKNMMVFFKMLDKQLQSLSSSQLMEEFTPESMMVLDKLAAWNQQLETFKNKFQVYDFDKSMKKLINKDDEAKFEVNPIPNLVSKLVNMNTVDSDNKSVDKKEEPVIADKELISQLMTVKVTEEDKPKKPEIQIVRATN